MSRLRAGLLALAALCAAPAGSAESLRVFAAASLADAFAEIAILFEREHPGIGVELNFAGSQLLQTQIEQGAPADVFAAADVLHAEALRRGGTIDGHRVFARNAMVVVAQAGEGRVRALQDLARPGVKLVLAGPGVPAGRYAVEVLAKLAADGRFGRGFRARVEANVVSQELNVRAVVAKVALGEADAGFAYRTDAAASDRVRAIPIPDRYNVVGEYPIATLSRSPRREQAQAFVALVLGQQGQSILRRHGFDR